MIEAQLTPLAIAGVGLLISFGFGYLAAREESDSHENDEFDWVYFLYASLAMMAFFAFVVTATPLMIEELQREVLS